MDRTLDQVLASKLAAAQKKLEKSALQQIAADLLEQIYRRIKDGYGVSNGKQSKLAPLSDTYIKWRGKNSNKLDSTTSPRKSNLTKSGQMLDSMVTEVSNGEIIITFGNGEAKGKARYNNETRPFFDLTNTELDHLINILKQTLIDAMNEAD